MRRLEPMVGKLPSGGHAKFTKHLMEVVLDSRGTDVKLGRDFLIGGTVSYQLRNPLFLWCQVVSTLDSSTSNLLPRRKQFSLSALCEGLQSES